MNDEVVDRYVKEHLPAIRDAIAKGGERAGRRLVRLLIK